MPGHHAGRIFVVPSSHGVGLAATHLTVFVCAVSTLAVMGDAEVTSNIKGALVGAMISGGFGLAWSLWGASGLSGAASTAVRVAGIALGVFIVLWSAYLWRRAPGEGAGSGTMFSSGAYRLIVALEVLVLIGGNLLLGVIGHREYVIAWVATVVGFHFLAFGRQFWAGFYGLGAALIAAGIVGAMVGLAGGRAGAIRGTAGLIAAASLFVAGTATIVNARARASA
jgi:hypothetical protein